MARFATQVQIRRGTDAENDAFTGAEGEVTMDLTNKQLRVHDGQTMGGMKIPNIETVFGTSQIQDGAITEPKLSADLQTKINEKTSGGGLPIGATVQYCGDTVPDNFMWCDGSAISRTTYASLFAVIGTKYGKGNGSTTFNLPNFNSAGPWGAPDWEAWQALQINTNVTLPYDGYLLVTNHKDSDGVIIWYSGRQLMKFTPATTTGATNSRTMLIPFRKGETIRVEANYLDTLPQYYKLKPTVPTEKWIIRYI